MATPPILFINTDQLRADFLGCYGFPVPVSPNIDRLAAQSLRFDQAFTASPICTPARYSLLSGQYPSQHHAITCSHGRTPDVLSLVDSFNQLGYHSVAVGKLHHNPPDDAFGFNEVHLHDGTFRNRRPYSFYSRYLAEKGIDENLLDYAADMEGHPDKESLKHITHWGSCALNEEDFETTQVAKRAIQCIESWTSSQSPFFYVSFLAPHSPYCPPAPWHQAFPPADMPPAPRETPEQLLRKNPMLRDEVRHAYTDAIIADIRAQYCGLIGHLDLWIGRLLEAFSQRFGSDALIVLTSDHGDFMGEHHRCEKNQMYDSATRVPLLLHAPGRIAPGSSSALLEQTDLLPTLLGLLDAPGPLPRIPGRDFSDSLRDGSFAGRPHVFAEYHTENVQFMIRTPAHKLIAYLDKRPGRGDGIFWEFYDLAADPHELENLAGRSECAETETGLRNILLGQLLRNRRFDPPSRLRFGPVKA